MRQLTVPGAWLHAPAVHTDDRGTFHETFRSAEFTEAVGGPFHLAQANVSVSRQGALRGIHYADVPPGQAKYITCLRGAVLDVAVDIRVGSPSFGSREAVELTESNHRSLYLAEGLGHAFLALTDDATVMYFCSEPYTPAREHTIHPLDPDLAIPWPKRTPLTLSARDRTAPSLAEALRAGSLPRFRPE